MHDWVAVASDALAANFRSAEEAAASMPPSRNHEVRFALRERTLSAGPAMSEKCQWQK
jgi:hypothetical protein